MKHAGETGRKAFSSVIRTQGPEILLCLTIDRPLRENQIGCFGHKQFSKFGNAFPIEFRSAIDLSGKDRLGS